MTAEEAAMIMMSGGGGAPRSSGIIWSAFQKEAPLAVITISPKVTYYLYEMGDVIGTYISDDDTYIRNGYKGVLVGVLKLNGSPVYYHILSDNYGHRAENIYEYIDGSLYQSFKRQIKHSVNVSNISIKISNNTANFVGTIKWYQDCLNFAQAEYSDGSHWEETYAWAPSYTPLQSSVSLTFDRYPEVVYTDQIYGDTIEAKYSNWATVCSDILDAPSGVFPILSYTADEDHFDETLYLNDDAVNRHYYDLNVEYIAKWGTTDLWE